MNEGLFRKEVLAEKRGQRMGGIALQPPVFGWIFLCVGMLVVASIFGLLFFGRYTRHERSEGTLVPNGGIQNVAPSQPGIVTRILVAEGSQVHAGQALIEVSGEQDSAALGETHSAVAAQLKIKREQLHSELAQAEQLSSVQQQDIATRISMLHTQSRQIEEQIALQKQRVDSSNALYEQWAALRASGIVTKLQILQQHDSALQNEMQLKDMNRLLLDAGQQLSQAEGSLKQLPFNLETKRNELGRQIADVEQALLENEARRAIVLRAQTDGLVANLMVQAGQPVESQKILMTILPVNAQLQAELWVPSRAIGFTAVGDRVVLRYQAFPFQNFGEQYGRIGALSHSAIAPGELSKLLGRDVSEPRYRVLVNLDRQNVPAYGKFEMLKPGMAVDADILLERHRLIDWVLEPLRGMSKSWRGDIGGDPAR
jgi:membrane fusion protein